MAVEYRFVSYYYGTASTPPHAMVFGFVAVFSSGIFGVESIM